MIESRFSVLGTVGARTTIMKSCSALGPSLRVIRFVSSFETGFSMYQASCLVSLLANLVERLLPWVVGSRSKGS